MLPRPTIHQIAWKGNSAKFAGTEFSEVRRGWGMVGKRRYTLRTILRPPAPSKG
jgi:hypothetical protein